MKISNWLKTIAVVSLLIQGSAYVYGSMNGVRVSDGKEDVIFSFSSVPTVTFEGDVLKISSSEGIAEFPTTSEITFDFVEYSGVHNITGKPDIVIQITSTQVKISGLMAGEVISVFDFNGKAIVSSKADTEGRWNMNIAALPKSPLIFKTKSNAYKLKIR